MSMYEPQALQRFLAAKKGTTARSPHFGHVSTDSPALSVAWAA